MVNTDENFWELHSCLHAQSVKDVGQKPGCPRRKGSQHKKPEIETYIDPLSHLVSCSFDSTIQPILQQSASANCSLSSDATCSQQLASIPSVLGSKAVSTV